MGACIPLRGRIFLRKVLLRPTRSHHSLRRLSRIPSRKAAVAPAWDLFRGSLMSSFIPDTRPQPDQVLADIADYVTNRDIQSDLAYETARYCLMDSLGCAMEALTYPACRRLLGPIVEGTTVPNGARVPGTRFQLDPVQAAFDIGTLIRWLDFNDTWLA